MEDLTLVTSDNVYFIVMEDIDTFLSLNSPVTIQINKDPKYRNIPYGMEAVVISRELVKSITPSTDFNVSVKLGDYYLSRKSLGDFLDPNKTGILNSITLITKRLLTGGNHSIELSKNRLMILTHQVSFEIPVVKDIMFQLGVAISNVMVTGKSFTLHIDKWEITVDFDSNFYQMAKENLWYKIVFPN